DFLDRNAFRGEQPFGHLAVRTYGSGVHQDFGCHDFSSGMLACCHAAMPPRSETTSPKPSLRSRPATFVERFPRAHDTMIGRAFTFSSSFMRASISPSGMWRALVMCP